MTSKEFMNLPMHKKLEVTNELLKKQTKDHLKNVSEELGIPYNAFTREMRQNGEFHYNQSSKRYEKLMSLEEYEKYLKLQPSANHDSNETLEFIEAHLEELKSLLDIKEKELILDRKVYDPTSEYANKSLQLNIDVYKEFSEFINAEFPHFRQRDLLSQSLLDFIKNYQKAPSS